MQPRWFDCVVNGLGYACDVFERGKDRLQHVCFFYEDYRG